MSRNDQESAGGCLGCLGIIIVIALVMAAAVAVATIVDPFSWLPPIEDAFADCPLDGSAEPAGCDFGTGYPGFWLHVIVNVLYAVAVAALLFGLVVTGGALREARTARYDGDAQVEAYNGAVGAFTLTALGLAALAVAPVVVAVV